MTSSLPATNHCNGEKMKTNPRPVGYKLPTTPSRASGTSTQGFVTPAQDRNPQIQSIPPRRVLPIIFLPGIMGSNLRISAARQLELEKSNNIAWRPDNKTESLALVNATPAERQKQLDPRQTEVDEYDPDRNLTGNAHETSDGRHSNAQVNFYYKLSLNVDGPLLRNDPIGSKPRKLKEHKVRERGWGEVYFGSYKDLLEMCEQHLNTAYFGGKLNPWWNQILNVSPREWHAHDDPPLSPLTEQDLRGIVKSCWFPVHAMGYNWLRSNSQSGARVAKRITELMTRYSNQGFQCEKVIIVTHSMGGLVARAVIHPKMGNLSTSVLGIVHGVMPAIGAGAAYKRMRCGFEDAFYDPAPKVLGNYGNEVTAILGNAQGGLELLPSCAYGNDWLRTTHKGKTLMSLPKNGDPYEEIYKVRGKWYSLLRPAWINPAGDRNSSFENTCILLDRAKDFHDAIADTYHDQSYAHYGADASRPAWHRVIWALDDTALVLDADGLKIASDDRQGTLHVTDPRHPTPPGEPGPKFAASMQPAVDPGDETVPQHSAEHQFKSKKFKGIFRQLGYEHQGSYKDDSALFSTMYSIVNIAKTMKWSK